MITDDVPMGIAPRGGAPAHQAGDARERLVAAQPDPRRARQGLRLLPGKPATAFAPVAVTPDELGEAWDGGKLHLPLSRRCNGKPFGQPDAGDDMTFDFGS